MTKDNNSGDKTSEGQPTVASTASPVGTVTNQAPKKERTEKRMASAEEHEAFVKEHGAELIIKPLSRK